MQTITVFVVKLKQEILSVTGIGESTDTFQCLLPEKALSYLFENKDVLDTIPHGQKRYLSKVSNFWGEDSAYHLTGKYGDLHLYTKEIEINDKFL